MTSQTTPISAPDDWQAQLRDCFTSARALLDFVNLSNQALGSSDLAAKDFAVKVPRSFARRMRPGDPTDPLLRQVLAHRNELLEVPGFSNDPVGETGARNKQPGIIQKYQGRVLLIVASGCAINCRYCFRRHFPYAENRNSRSQWQQALKAIGKDSSITEVILSGGDPLVPTDSLLSELVDQIAGIPHVKRLRIHTRFPVVIPARITDSLIDALTRPSLQTVMVIHANHANEIDHNVSAAMARLHDGEITLLNQTVLLAGVNDNPDTLVDLSEQLFSTGVLPYYLHLLDPVRGAAHFDVPEEAAAELMEQVTARLPGYLVPKLVREIAGEPAKVGV